MKYLIDANILLRLADQTSSQHELVSRAIAELFARNDELLISMQGFAEFWAVATRPETANGLGFTIESTRELITEFQGIYGFVPDLAESLEIWLELVTKHQVIGKPTHDVRLVALMKAHRLEQILTINVSDFKRFTEIKAVHPFDVTGSK
jgi:predicted nucleic acid-binding protein